MSDEEDRPDTISMGTIRSDRPKLPAHVTPEQKRQSLAIQLTPLMDRVGRLMTDLV